MPPFVQGLLDSGNTVVIIAGIISVLLTLIPMVIERVRASERIRQMVDALIDETDAQKREDLLRGIALLQVRHSGLLRRRRPSPPTIDPGG